MKSRKALLIIMCLIAALALTACHTETDPWPAATDAPAVQPAATDASAVPQGEPTAAPTQQVVEQTAQPGGDEEPGLNG